VLQRTQVSQRARPSLCIQLPESSNQSFFIREINTIKTANGNGNGRGKVQGLHRYGGNDSRNILGDFHYSGDLF